MRKFTLVFGLFISIICHAQLLLENFEYSSGSLLSDHNWDTFYGAPSSLSVTNGLQFSKYDGSDVGNAAVLDKDKEQLYRSFLEVNSGSVYYSFMFQPVMSDKSGYFISLWDKNMNTWAFSARVLYSSDGRIGLTFGNNTNAVYGSTLLDGNKTYLVVVKYTILPGDNNDQVSMYLFENMPLNEPTNSYIGPLSDGSRPDIKPSSIALRAFSSNQWLVVDGIRVGTSWSDVMTPVLSNTGNVVNDQVKIQYTKNGINLMVSGSSTLISVYDLTGKLLLSRKFNTGSYQMTLPNGIYLLRIGSVTQKIVISTIR